jgi:hypothetical protein
MSDALSIVKLALSMLLQRGAKSRTSAACIIIESAEFLDDSGLKEMVEYLNSLQEYRNRQAVEAAE